MFDPYDPDECPLCMFLVCCFIAGIFAGAFIYFSDSDYIDKFRKYTDECDLKGGRGTVTKNKEYECWYSYADGPRILFTYPMTKE